MSNPTLSLSDLAIGDFVTLEAYDDPPAHYIVRVDEMSLKGYGGKPQICSSMWRWLGDNGNRQTSEGLFTSIRNIQRTELRP